MAFTNTTVLAVPMPLAPASLTHAIAFLTRPLLPLLAPSTLALLHSALRRTLAAAYVPNRASRLVLAFGGPGAAPPRPVAAACRAAGVAWAAWAPLLGARGAFAVVIEPRVVCVAYPASGLVPAQSAVVWSEAAAVPRRLAPLSTSALTATVDEDTEPHVRISKARVQAASLRATLHSALARSQTRSTTLAQRLLAVEEEQEAEELFAMLSTSVLSPTPTRDAFPTAISALAAASPLLPYARSAGDEQAASPSPSSSRSSTPSSFGSAYDSDAESLTSASSASSFDFLDSTKPSSAVPTTLPIPAPMTRSVPAFARRVPAPAAFVPRPSLSTPVSTPFVSTPAAASAAAPAAAPATIKIIAPAAPRVWIDSTKKDVTKYLYQGGVSTVLTGGVMLGGGGGARKGAAAGPKPAATPKSNAPKFVSASRAAAPWANATEKAGAMEKAAAPTARAEEVPKYRAPIGSGRWGAPAHRFAAAGEGSWRRAARV
ncbi:hypothetical protein BJ912DRAFT_1046206 [Pholiota molesta]|nr:hypothetical protein BJ912DRAFT_1046206 [Pholiota molesta]